MNKTIYLLIFIAILATMQCSKSDNLVIHKQVTGMETNCYLVYDSQSKEAALIDVGGPIDSLLSFIDKENLTLKYFLFTHGHVDHVAGLPEIKDRFPDAKVCVHKQDYEDMFITEEWAINYYGQETLDEWFKNPVVKKTISLCSG